MSASEMERLRRRLAAAEEALRTIDCCEEHACRLCDERINSVFRPHAALSGSSAPQAPDSEELLKALRAAADALDVGEDDCEGIRLNWDMSEQAYKELEAVEENLRKAFNAACAALSMKSEGSDPDSSQKGSGR